MAQISLKPTEFKKKKDMTALSNRCTSARWDERVTGVQAIATCLPITFAALYLVVCTCDMLAPSRDNWSVQAWTEPHGILLCKSLPAIIAVLS